ncbi:glycosyltransferase [Cellulomonas bogoriensis]|uniref:D-inositol 3-phosphate glycosyltransferase n=1 Tax=Cellulomonas bogoriensis 69B4 = DSM 16987 TaxID=1386082 RepID=A0A0A0C1N1_9CELL|nr:glycosyltransferase [Cellulomonas bogoriensis]KGM14111.1 GDP-mannose-dependent alpha-(1-6)-phosphatidylinositol dimannoside mannosyltransferase [Cellulomonas bogoriensis 69B4 = DSM 16987]
MHVVHLTNAYAPHSGGIRTTAHALGAGYRERGHQFTLVAPGTHLSTERRSWGTLIRLPGPVVPWTGGYRALLDVRRVRRTLDALTPDRLEVSDRFTLGGLGAWADARGVPAVMIAHERLDGVLRTGLHLPAGVARTVADRHNDVMASAFRVVTTTRFAAREFDRIGVRTVHVPLGVDLEAFTPVRAPARSGAPVLVMCSRLSPEKRPDLAIEALRLLHAGGLRARLVVIGDGPSARAVERAARGLPVTFLGHVTDRSAVAHLLAHADAVLAPGPVETFGLAALEALACGTPVVASVTSALVEMVDEESGVCAEPTAVGFAAATREVLSRSRDRTRSAARRRALQFPWSRTVDAMLAVHGALPSTSASERRTVVGGSVR